MFTVIGTQTYEQELDDWSKADKEAAHKLPKQLASSPLVGRSLGLPFLREKRVGGKRVYYLVYNDLNLILLVATSAKKDQQETIDHIKDQLPEFRTVAEEIIKQGV